MKNIIKTIRNITLNKKGAVSRNAITGLSVALFSAFVIYGVYTSYNNSPAYNPARRALFTGEGNLSVNSFNSDTVSLQTSDGIPANMRTDYGEFGKTSGTGSVQNQIRENEAEFENARAYLEAQKAGTGSARSGAVAVSSSEGGQETNPMLTPQNGHRNSYETAGAGTAGSTAGYIAGVISGSGEKDKDGKSKPEMAADKKGATVINKLAVSNGSSFGGASGGARTSGGGFASAGSSMGGGSSRGSQDSSAQALPTANVAGTANSSVFKAGRGGTMGGFSIAQGSRGAESGGTRGGGDSTKGELNKAYFYSGRAKQSLYSAGGKNMVSAASDAAAAFDGSKGNEGGARIAGDNVVGSDPRNLAGYKHLGGDLKKITDDTTDDKDEQNTLADAGTIHMLMAIPIALAAMVCICGLKKAAVAGGPYAWLYYIAIAVIAFAALYAIWGADYDGNGHDIIKDMDNLFAVNKRLGNHQDFQTDSWASWIPWVILPVLTGGIIAAAIWGQKLNFEGSGVGKKVMSMAEAKMTNEMVKQTTEELTKYK